MLLDIFFPNFWLGVFLFLRHEVNKSIAGGSMSAGFFFTVHIVLLKNQANGRSEPEWALLLR